ncbi:hypothetical protein EV207_12561 [Scopulibacillus darangshiensis]|uniref:Uncharacterized protein n=1 Tax=Scopulibacillus darangshiensis TaxID=442528 RepID=A0A4R2NRL9_9BACL|nr:hypothetical protein [Scopulibacillus darangshiensis]TCP24500.1 hypothetical protein EV207_12561 [Scopulibacillus darangshiensis]
MNEKNIELVKGFEERVSQGQEYFSRFTLDGFDPRDESFIVSAICKKYGKQDFPGVDMTGFRVLEATKKFMKGEGQHKNRPKDRVLKFLECYEENK